jgi:hypothetical protein
MIEIIAYGFTLLIGVIGGILTLSVLVYFGYTFRIINGVVTLLGRFWQLYEERTGQLQNCDSLANLCF